MNTELQLLRHLVKLLNNVHTHTESQRRVSPDDGLDSTRQQEWLKPRYRQMRSCVIILCLYVVELPAEAS